MKQRPLNDGWRFARLDEEGNATSFEEVTLPHDAMLGEERSATAASGSNSGWFEGRDYLYTRTLDAPEEWRDQQVLLEFEGVYHNAEVWVNGEQAAFRPYGYTNFYVDLTPYLTFGAGNELKVVARNADQPNSRWYSGAGIYRPVSLWTGPRERHLDPNAIRVSTTRFEPPQVHVQVNTAGTGPVLVEILDDGQVLISEEVQSKGKAKLDLTLPEAELWTPDHPALYTCRATFGSDSAQTTFGIRTLTWDAENGLALNGERVILRGACDHHTNGILGAAGFADAEERKMRLLKESGYNAIRSAHNPCSKALLDACDRIGMLVMDEYVDQWYIHKTPYDYVDYFEQWWHQDLADMVDKDFNHPCVVLYSTGNEVSETAEPKGIELAGQLTDYLHELDDTRPVTCGINIDLNLLVSMGHGLYGKAREKDDTEGASQKSDEPANRDGKAVGSQFFNNLAGTLGAEVMKRAATLPPCDAATRDAYANMDIAGYNYGIYRYPHDLREYPERLILGSETFCSDAYTFWEEAKREPRLIGDFVWAGMDYMGETMIGAWEYADYAKNFSGGYGWIAGAQGRLDLTGKPSCESLYTRVAFEQAAGPFIGVQPVNHTGDAHTPSSWRMSNAIASWSWQGCEGRRANVEVYSRAPLIRLVLNGRTVAIKQRPKDDCITRFACPYRPGTLEAVALDRNGGEIGRSALHTAGSETMLSVEPEEQIARTGHLCFVRLRFTDRKGELKPLERRLVHVEVGGGRLVALGNGCAYNERGYLQSYTDTYYGEALAIVQADGSGPVRLAAQSGELSGAAEIPLER